MVTKLVPQAEKTQNLIITYYEFDFDIVENVETFEDIAGYQVNAEWVGITHKDGSNTVLPASSVKRIRTQFVNKE